MRSFIARKKRVFLVIAATAVFFILSSYFSARYETAIAGFVDRGGIFSVALYMAVMALAVIVAPFETLPLLPVAASAWGALAAALMTIAGWTAGSAAAFLLGRHYGRRFVCRYFVHACDLEEWGNILTRRHLFWLLALARFALPIDIVSYAAAIFTRISLSFYLLATIVGIIPFAFIFSYGAGVSVRYQLLAGAAALLMIFFGYNRFKKFMRHLARD